MELDRTEARVLGALIEKRWTTPDAYPLSLNALIAACNQKSNRAPVLHLEEFEILGCLMELRQKGLTMIHERDGGRVRRYGERLTDELRMSRQEIAILAELLLRGPQTAGELTRRCGRMAPMGSQSDVDELLRELARGGHAHLLSRESGQRYARWQQLLCTQTDAPADDDEETETDERETPAAPAAAQPFVQIHAPRPAIDAAGPVLGVAMPAASSVASAASEGDLRAELEELRQELIALRKRVAELEA